MLTSSSACSATPGSISDAHVIELIDAHAEITDTSALQDLALCPQCVVGELEGVVIDARAAADALEDELIAPLQRVQWYFSQPGAYLTRMYTTLDPSEMTVDPTFDYVPFQSTVSNNNILDATRECRDGREYWALQTRSGYSAFVQANTQYGGVPNMPAALTIHQLADGRLWLVDDRGAQVEETARSLNAYSESEIAARADEEVYTGDDIGRTRETDSGCCSVHPEDHPTWLMLLVGSLLLRFRPRREPV